MIGSLKNNDKKDEWKGKMIRLTTLCYLEKNDHYLMLHRVCKKDDVNAGKWIGIGGKFEPGEAPEDCMIRETAEETGFRLNGCRYRGLITFIYADKDPEYIFTYTSEDFETGSEMENNGGGLPVPECDEGVFCWVPKKGLFALELWEGDRYLLEYLVRDRSEPFSLKLCYDEHDVLTEAWELSGQRVRLK